MKIARYPNRNNILRVFRFLKDWGARLASTLSSWRKWLFFPIEQCRSTEPWIKSFYALSFSSVILKSLSVLIFDHKNPTSWKRSCCRSVTVSHLFSCRRTLPVKSRTVQQALWGNSCLLCSLAIIIALIFETVKAYNKFHFIEVLLSAKVELFKVP